MKRIVWTLLLLLSVSFSYAELHINEVMQVNLNDFDEGNNLPEGWIELRNWSDERVSLKGYSIQRDTEDDIYRIPVDTFVAPNSYILIYCDGIGRNQHTSFKLKYKKSATLRLISPEGEVLDMLRVPANKQMGVSFGYGADEELGWLIEPTPMAENGNTSERFLSAPQLTVESGLFTAPFVVNLKDSTAGVAVRYTTDGTSPTENDSIFPSQGLKVSKTTNLRLESFANGCVPSSIAAYSYIFHNREVTLPVVTLSVDYQDIYDEKNGILSEKEYWKYANYEYDWLRVADIKYFDENGQKVMDQKGQIRVMGNTSRQHPMKSFALYSSARYGAENFEYPFFKEKPHIEAYNSISLRNAGNDFLIAHLRDAVSQTYIAATMKDIDYQAYQPVIVYLNGEYYGLMNLRERTNHSNIDANHPECGDNVDVVENWSKANSGDLSNALTFYLHFLSDTTTYETLSNEMDIKEFLNYYIGEMYFGNADFPDNNVVMWRSRNEDGKWRWILKDLDMTLNHRFEFSYPYKFYISNYFEQLMVPPSAESDTVGTFAFSTRLIRKLCMLKPFQDLFIEQFAVNMGDFLLPEYVSVHIDSLAQRIEYEFPFTYDLYHEYRDSLNVDWYQEVQWMKDYLVGRNRMFYNSMGSFFNLGSVYPLTINKENQDNVSLNINGVDLIHSVFDGCYYENRPLVVKAKMKDEGHSITGWNIELVGTDTMHYFVKGDLLRFSLPQTSGIESVRINVLQDVDLPGIAEMQVYGVEGGLMVIAHDDASDFSVYDLLGRVYLHRQLPVDSVIFVPLPQGCYIVQGGSERRKVIVDR